MDSRWAGWWRIGELAAGEADCARPQRNNAQGLGEDATQDAVPAPPASPVARVGQIWQLGKHRLLAAILRARNTFHA